MHNPYFCYTTDPIRSFTNMFGSDTSYEAIRRFNFTTVNRYKSTCTPSRFWYLGKHGGSFPSLSFMQQMIELADSTIQKDIANSYHAGRTTLCRDDFEAIRNWTRQANFTVENAYTFSEASVVQMQNIARRYQQTFPTLLTETYSPERFHFRYTNRTSDYRTNSSTRAFVAGLFGENEATRVIYADIPDTDWLLRPFSFCPLFDEEIGWGSDEREAFIQGPEFEEMQEQVNRKLGFTGSNRLNLQQILTMWKFCAFETASTFEFSESPIGNDAAWCVPFSVAHHLLLEYVADLALFYVSGYGASNQRLLQNSFCGLAQDLLSYLQSDDEKKVRHFVAYAEQLQGFIATLELFRDVWPMHRNNFAQQSARHWMSSLISPNAGHLAVILYECEDGDDDILFYLNERPVLVPGCDQQSGVCKLSDVVRILGRFAAVNCETFFCSNN